MKVIGYLTIQAWMRTELNLKGNELLLYALIYGFSQDEESTFKGSLSYMGEWVGCTRPTVISTLESLTEKGLITKTPLQKDGNTRYQYSAVPFDGQPPKPPSGDGKPAKEQKSEMSEESKEIFRSWPKELRDAVNDWFRYKKEKKDKYTPSGANKLISRINNVVAQSSPEAVIVAINNSMSSNYQGIVWEWAKQGEPQKPHDTPRRGQFGRLLEESRNEGGCNQ